MNTKGTNKEQERCTYSKPRNVYSLSCEEKIDCHSTVTKLCTSFCTLTEADNIYSRCDDFGEAFFLSFFLSFFVAVLHGKKVQADTLCGNFP